MRRHSSVLNFHGPGSVKPSWESPSVPLLPAAPQRSASPWRDNVNHLQSDIKPRVSMALRWPSARLPMRSGRACDPETGAIVASSSTPKPPFPGPTDQDLCCSVEWKGWQEKNAHFAPSEVALLAALDLGSTAWTDSASLQLPCSCRTNKLFRGGRPSALVLPLRPLDADQGADTSVARGIQWWPPATAPKIKPTNRTTATKSVDAKVQVAIAYATNCDEAQRQRA